MTALHKNAMWVLVFLVACGLATLVRFEHVHQESGEWRMRPSAEPPMLRYNGHVYDRVGTADGKEIGFVKRQKDLGGGAILAPRTHGVPTNIEVRDVDTFYSYQLAG